MRRSLSVLLSGALLLSLAACGGPGDTGGGSSGPSSGSQTETPDPAATPFTLPVYAQFSLHPTLGGSRANLTLSPLLYEPLFQVDERFEAVPVLCGGYTASPDKLIWTFRIRPGVTFSDGTPLTGEAAARAIDLARTQGRYAGRLADVAAVTGDEDTVTITLSRPNGALPLLLDIPIALGDGDRPAGTGPYVLTEGADGLSLTARDGWWQAGALPLTDIPLHDVTRSDELIYAFDTGDVSLVDVDLMATNALGYGGSYQTWDYSTTGLLYVGFNARSGLCREPAVRRALALAVDRDTIAQTIYAGHAEAAALPVHPDSALYDRDIAAQLSHDPERLMARAEELDLAGRTVRLLVNSESTGKVAAARLIAYQLETAGLTVRLELLPFEDYAAALRAGNFDLYLGETVLTADFDPSPLLAPAGALNYGGWQDAAAGELMAVFRSASPEERPQAAARLWELLLREAPIVPIAFKNSSVLTQWGRASGLDPVRGNIFHGFEHWNIS